MTATRYTMNTVADAICARLELAGVGAWLKPGDTIPEDTTVAVVHAWLPDHPDAAVSVTVHGTPPGVPAPSHRWRVQVWARAPHAPANVNTLADDIEAALTAHHARWGELMVDRCHRYNTTPMGRDPSGRWERACNYELITH